MKTCGYCNHEVQPNSNACSNCGGLWPVYGRSNIKLKVEQIHHSIVHLNGAFVPNFEAESRPYSLLVAEIAIGIVAIVVAGIFIFLGVFLAINLIALVTEDNDLLVTIISILRYLGSKALQVAVWLIVFFISIAVISVLIRLGGVYYREKLNRNC